MASILADIGTLIGSYIKQDRNRLDDLEDNYSIRVLPQASSFYTNRTNLETAKPVFMKYYSSSTDGRSGFYIYNSSRARSTADGVKYIDHTVTIANQGTGSGNGVWELQLGLVAEYMDEYLGSVYESL